MIFSPTLRRALRHPFALLAPLVLVLSPTPSDASLCTAPTRPFGYDDASKNEVSLERGCDFEVTGWRCAPGFGGVAHATECPAEDSPYVLSGCVAESKTFCKLMDPHQCRGTLHEFVLDTSGGVFPLPGDLFGQDKDGDQDPAVTQGGYHDINFADLDADGDLDVILPNTGRFTTGSETDGDFLMRRMGRMRYLENVQNSSSGPWQFKERYGKDANPFHEIRDDFELCQTCSKSNATCMNATSCANYFVDPDPRVGWIYPYTYLHPTFEDIDGDGDLDAVIGTYRGHLLFFENTGNHQTRKFVSVDLDATDHPLGRVSVSGFSAPVFVDADGDGDHDLVVGMASGALSYFERVKTEGPHGFAYEHRSDPLSNPFHMITVGGRSKPVFVDITGDDILDLVVSAYDGNIVLYANTGSAANPAFTIRKKSGENPFLAIKPIEYVLAVFVDVDGDGQEDMVTGDIRVGHIQFYRHLNTARAIIFEARDDAANNPFMLTAGSGDREVQRSAPFIIDIDGDNDGDLLVGSMDGSIRFFENVGALPQMPRFVRRTEPETNPFFEIRDILAWENTVPFLVDLDGDQDHDLVVASSPESQFEPRELLYFENIGTSQSARFNFTHGLTNLTLSQRHSPFRNLDIATAGSPKDKFKPSFADLDNDGDYDMVIGTVSGSFLYFMNNGTASSPRFARLGEDSRNNPFRGLDKSLSWSSPELFDLDGDDDIDLVVGLFDGTITYFENVGTRITAVFQEVGKSATTNPFHGIDVSHYAIPRFYDCDGDGSRDLLVGEYAGAIYYYERNGCNVPHLCSGLGTCLPNKNRDRAVCSCLPSITGHRCESCNAGAVEKRRAGGLSIVVPQNPVCQPIPAGAWSNKTGFVDGEGHPCPSGKFSPSIGATSPLQCEGCSKGMYAEEPGATSCLPCLPGKFANKTGMNVCDNCASGRKSQSSKATRCSGCSRGYFQGKRGQTTCLPCLPGEFGDKEGMVSCRKCAAGLFSGASESISCSDCAAATFSGAAGSSKCTACAPGKFAPQNASVVCERCPKGWFQNLSMQKACFQTVRGQYQSGLGSVAPIQVAEGWHGFDCGINGTGCKASSPCGMGYRGTLPSSERCVPCLPGETTAAAGAIACQMCGTGKIAPRPGSRECLSCNSSMPINEYASQLGSTQCAVCPAGFTSHGSDCRLSVADPALPLPVKVLVQATAGEERESVHDPGRGLNITWVLSAGATGSLEGWSSFEVRVSASSDFPLSDDGSNRTFSVTDLTQMSLRMVSHASKTTIAPLFDQVVFVQVRTVGEGGYSVGTWSTTTIPWLTTSSCADDEFLDTSPICSSGSPSDPACWKCTTCPRGSSCKGPVTWDMIRPLFGWWKIPVRERLLPVSPSLSRGADIVFTECRFPPACPGAPNPEFFDKFFDKDTGEDLARFDTTFDPNANGSQLCAHGLGYLNGSRLCGACMPLFHRSSYFQCKKCPAESANYSFIVSGALLLVLMVVGIGAVRINANGRQELSESLVKITLNYFQVACLFVIFPLKWPDAMIGLFSFQGALSTFGKHLINPDCVAEQTQGLNSAAALMYTKQMAILTAGVTLSLLASAFFRIVSFRQTGSCFFRKRRSASQTTAKDQLVVVIGAVAFFIFPTLCIQTFELFDCVRIGKFVYLEQALDEPCWTGRHAAMVLAIGYPQLLLFVIGLPIVALVFLIRNKQKLDSPVVMTRYGMFFSGYKTSRYFWEVWIALRKVLFCALSVFGKQLGPQLQALIAILVLGISIATEIKFDPWDQITPRHRILPIAEARALSVQWATVWAGLVMYSLDGIPEWSSILVCITIIGVGVNVVLMLWMFLQIGRSTLDESKAAKAWIYDKLLVINRRFSFKGKMPGSFRSVKSHGNNMLDVISVREEIEMVANPAYGHEEKNSRGRPTPASRKAKRRSNHEQRQLAMATVNQKRREKAAMVEQNPMVDLGIQQVADEASWSGVALYDYEARELGEISLEEGDVVESVVDEGGGWGKGRNTRTGEVGTFPMSFVE